MQMWYLHSSLMGFHRLLQALSHDITNMQQITPPSVWDRTLPSNMCMGDWLIYRTGHLCRPACHTSLGAPAWAAPRPRLPSVAALQMALASHIGERYTSTASSKALRCSTCKRRKFGQSWALQRHAPFTGQTRPGAWAGAGAPKFF